MLRLTKTLIFIGLLAFLLTSSSAARAQNPVVRVSFRNDTNTPVIVQAWTVVNKMPRRGQAITVNPGKILSDNSLPAGTRNISIYDAAQPTRVYLKDQAIDVPRSSDLLFSIRPHPNIPQRMILRLE